MILLDPDLAANPSSHVHVPSRPESARVNPGRNNRIPSIRALTGFLRESQTAVKLRGQVTVLLTTDTSIRRLNRQFRGKNSATDVLSFPASAPGPFKIAGDLAISIDTARRQAAGLHHSLGHEIKILILHGLLHLAGYDHETDKGEMARREQRLRAQLRLPQGLIERTMSPTVKLRANGAAKVSAGSTPRLERKRRVLGPGPSAAARGMRP